MKCMLFTRSSFDPQVFAPKLAEYLFEHPKFSPDRYGSYEPLKALGESQKKLALELMIDKQALDQNRGRVNTMVFYKRLSNPKCFYHVHWTKLPHVSFDISSFSIEQQFISNQPNMEEWLSFLFGLIEIFRPYYALFALRSETQSKNFLAWFSSHPNAKNPGKGIETRSGIGLTLLDGIPGVYWGNYFSPFYMKFFGDEKIETLPCVDKRILSTGGVFFTTSSHPSQWELDTSIELQQSIKNHLNPEAFFDLASIKAQLALVSPIPEEILPAQLQPPRHLPGFPFEIQPVRTISKDEEITLMQARFESEGFTLEKIDGNTMVFRDETGGMTKVTVGKNRKIENFPKI